MWMKLKLQLLFFYYYFYYYLDRLWADQMMGWAIVRPTFHNKWPSTTKFLQIKKPLKTYLTGIGRGKKPSISCFFFYWYIYLFRICGKTATAQRSASSSRTCTIRGRRITCCWIGQSEQPLWFELSAADGRSLLRSHSLETQSPFANQNKFSGFQPYQRPRMSKKQIYYSDKYNDEDFEYRYNCRFGVVVDVNVLEEC